ncbi:MAG: hypothetical protein P5702_10890 [Limnospira sp. PMC 1291.21]|uniref:Uncharacterized protein n=2 Tax=Limnospira TaxID=2596745 RepID=B5W1L5_LIMMA|nr:MULTISPECIES: hypothetical protein [Limnospira]EKD08557.1 hypothetical protein SPLC1_S220040 [Arthrospira platensis C1]MDC0838342.1 hypothetical protein [Limnoraphis robusta]MDY7053723.1 hypothetical protein [Limnospira fusiformis LS22]QJB24860.1 hypothetical protein HFV01_02380 [Limnospira fusiformis SAG 85.79]RAQ48992.1 hypothetical protein B9S53_01185 [Arthrospira sp. O9.13F]
MVILAALFISGWLAVSVIGTMAYFRGEQSKPIHMRNWNSDSFDSLSQALTGVAVDYSQRVPAYSMDAYRSQNFSK